jgi:hypothetical protein
LKMRKRERRLRLMLRRKPREHVYSTREPSLCAPYVL